MDIVEIEDCSIGLKLNKECHAQTYVQKKSLNKVSNLSDVDKELIAWRSGIELDNSFTICRHHEIFLLKKYSTFQTTCCDPFNSHQDKRKGIIFV